MMNFIAFGKNVVEKIIHSELFEFNKIIILEEKKKTYLSLINILNKKSISYNILPLEKFNLHIPDKKNQGIIALIKSYKYYNFEEIISLSLSKKNPLIIILDRIEDPHNLGAVIRTCSGLGNVSALIIPRKQQVHMNNTVIKVSTGGVSDIPICIVENLDDCVNKLKNKKFTIFSTDCSENSINYNESKVSFPSCIIFGNEHDGIKKSIIKKSDFLISIPMKNKMNSLNISASFAIITSFFLNS